MEELQAKVALSGEAWESNSYYKEAEQWTFLFWEKGRVFRSYFDMLDISRICELACGHGRHAEQVVKLGLANEIESYVLIDIFDANVNASRERLRGAFPRFSFVKGDGYSFRPLSDCSLTSIFCYDAMVHFEPDLVSAYLNDTFRVLAPGGKALYHHSNLQGSEFAHYSQNPHARNIMPWDFFRGAVRGAGLDIYDTRVIQWGKVNELDRVTLIEKPLA